MTEMNSYTSFDTAANIETGKEVRTTSETGGQKGVKPEAYDLIPWEAMDEIARVYAFGAEKYAEHNWRKGYEWGKSIAALLRHVTAFVRGEDRDPESGLSHLAHAGFHVLGLLTFWLDRDQYGKFDNRYRKAGKEDGIARSGWDQFKAGGRNLTEHPPRDTHNEGSFS